MTAVLALDPGTRQTAFVGLEADGTVLGHGIETNAVLVDCLLDLGIPCDWLAVEKVESYGMPVGAEVFETVWWAGRFWQEWLRWDNGAESASWVTRREVKLHLCGQARAKDANVRQALIDRYGPGKEAAIGRKASPGPLYGLKGDEWAALGVAVTWMDRQRTAAAAD